MQLLLNKEEKEEENKIENCLSCVSYPAVFTGYAVMNTSIHRFLRNVKRTFISYSQFINNNIPVVCPCWSPPTLTRFLSHFFFSVSYGFSSFCRCCCACCYCCWCVYIMRVLLRTKCVHIFFSFHLSLFLRLCLFGGILFVCQCMRLNLAIWITHPVFMIKIANGLGSKNAEYKRV